MAEHAGANRTGAAVEADGRVRRSLRSRQRILEALFALLEEGQLAPTAERVARRAGVGLRTVFRHFEDMESLYAELHPRVLALVHPMLEAALPFRGDQRMRAEQLVRLRATIFERVTPFMRSGRLHRRRSRYLQDVHRATLEDLRGHLRLALPEIDRLSPEAQLALEQAISFEAWDQLRTQLGAGRARAEDAMRAAVLALLASTGSRGEAF